jgi:hypothetical protein
MRHRYKTSGGMVPLRVPVIAMCLLAFIGLLLILGGQPWSMNLN